MRVLFSFLLKLNSHHPYTFPSPLQQTLSRIHRASHNSICTTANIEKAFKRIIAWNMNRNEIWNMNSNGLWLRSIKNRIHSVQCLSCTNWRNKREPLKRKLIWKISYFITKHNFFKNSFFPLVINEWNKLDTSLRRYTS